MMRFRHGPAWGRSRAADGNRQAPRRLVSDSQSFGGVMVKDKSILEKITDTMKDIANIAADAADHAVKAEEAPPSAIRPSKNRHCVTIRVALPRKTIGPSLSPRTLPILHEIMINDEC